MDSFCSYTLEELSLVQQLQLMHHTAAWI